MAQDELDKLQKEQNKDVHDFGIALVVIPILVALLLGCSLVQKFAEPIDRAGCVADCKAAGLVISKYEYEDNSCWCALPDGGEVKTHEFLEEP